MSTENIRVSNRKGRPNYPISYKLQVAIAACEPNISVAKLAQAHGLNPNMVFKWRREYRASQLGKNNDSTVLMPVTLSPEPATSAATIPTVSSSTSHTESMQVPATTSSIEIELNGAIVRVSGMVDPVQLRLVLRCLMPV